jgi:hypothetical protein
MPLDQKQIIVLSEAIVGYSFPAVCYDFINKCKINFSYMKELEEFINKQLRSRQYIDVKYGLGNILYWGYANIGYGDDRVKRFMEKINDPLIQEFQDLVNNNRVPSLTEIKKINMPEYSGLSFISKILMFLDTNNYCVLDQQLAKLKNNRSTKAISKLNFDKGKDTQIRITKQNVDVYNEWINECLIISRKYYNGKYRVVDIERGFFNLIQKGNLKDAEAIYNAA